MLIFIRGENEFANMNDDKASKMQQWNDASQWNNCNGNAIIECVKCANRRRTTDDHFSVKIWLCLTFSFSCCFRRSETCKCLVACSFLWILFLVSTTCGHRIKCSLFACCRIVRCLVLHTHISPSKRVKQKQTEKTQRWSGYRLTLTQHKKCTLSTINWQFVYVKLNGIEISLTSANKCIFLPLSSISFQNFFAAACALFDCHVKHTNLVTIDSSSNIN